ncbi:MAG: phage tail tube protein [Salinarimonas sp.]
MAAATSAAEFEADTYTAIKEVEDIGEFGDEAEEITFLSINDARVRKAKGARDAGALELVCAFDAADAGQVLMRSASASDAEFNFRVTLNDKPAGVGSTPSTFYFKALVSASKVGLGGANDIAKETFTLSISSGIVAVPAAAA